MKFVKEAKVKSFIYRPVENLGFQEVESPRICRKSAYEGAKYVIPKQQPALPSRKKTLGLIRVGG